MRASDIQREIDRMTTTRIVTDSNGRKHITTEPLLHPPMIEIEYELFIAGEQNKQEPVAWTRTDVDAPIIHEEMMQRHPELRQYYPVPLYYGPQE